MENYGPPQKSLDFALMKQISGVGPREIREQLLENLPEEDTALSTNCYFKRSRWN